MRIEHRLTLTLDADVAGALTEAGVESRVGFTTIVMNEDDPRWPAVERLATRAQAVDIVTTRASADELSRAPWLAMLPAWHQGYPQPEHGGGYLAAVYDLREFCDACGVGARQVAPFRLRGEPAWGARHVLQLHWVYDEYFARPDTWREVLQPLGIAASPVLHHRTGEALATVVQLVLGEVALVNLTLDGHPRHLCPQCWRPKHRPHVRGFLPPFATPPAAPAVVKSQEWFGSGAQAFRMVLVPAALYEAVAMSRIRGVEFLPMR